MVLQGFGKIGNLIVPSTLAAIAYHDIFDYPLTSGELIKWEVSEKIIKPFHLPKNVVYKRGLYVLKGRDGLILKRIVRKRLFVKKLLIAQKAAKHLGKLNNIRGVFLTGAVAMENGDSSSDIDLMIVVKSGKLWSTRILSYIILLIYGLRVRRYAVKNEKDKLCLNMWLDEAFMSWPEKERNIFSAHEIAQIKPLINKDLSYEKFIFANKWIKSYWPNSVSLTEINMAEKRSRSLLEKLCFIIESVYMRKKITNEIVSERRAIFHPVLLWPIIAGKLKGKGFII